MRYAFAGSRGIGRRVLDFLLTQQEAPLPEVIFQPQRDLVSEPHHSFQRHVTLGRRWRGLPDMQVQFGDRWMPEWTEQLKGMDYLFCVHYPHMLPMAAIGALNIGAVNLHPAYLPWNRGWHTPSWAILDGTPYGASLHFMVEEVDAGPIIARQQIDVHPCDTADTLYSRVMYAEARLFFDVWPRFVAGSARPETADSGPFEDWSSHKMSDLAKVQKLTPGEQLVVDKLRALTTSRKSEAARFEVDGRMYGVTVNIWED